MKMTTNDTLALYTSDGVFKTKIVITHPSDSTVVENDYGTIIVESPANTFGVTVDSTKFATPYDLTLINFIDSTNVLNSYGTTITESPANTFNIKVDSSLFATTYDINGMVTGSGTATRIAFWDGASSLSSNAALYWNNTTNRLSVNSGTSPVTEVDVLGRLNLRNTYGNTYIGNLIGNNSGTGDSNLGVGSVSLRALTTGTYNVSIGNNVMDFLSTGTSNLGFGNSALYTISTGSHNVAIGAQSLYSSNGLENVGIGKRAAFLNTGNYSTAIGSESLRTSSSGSQNTAIGYGSGYSNVGSNNVFIGFQSGFSETGSDKLYISNSTTASPLIGGNFSSGRVGINTAVASLTDALHVTGNIRGTAAYIDATNSPGTSGQVLSSTVTGTDWIDLPAGDITAVTVSAPVTGSSLSGPIPNIGVDTTDATAAALATQFDLLGKQATLVSGTNIKTVNSNSLLGSGNVSVGTLSALGAIGSTPNANAATISGATLNLEPASASFGGVVTTGTQTFAGSKTFNYLGGSEGTNVTTGTSLIMGDVNGKLENLYGSTGTNDLPLYDGTKWLLTKLKTVNGTSLLGSGDVTTSSYAYWRLSANSGTAFAVTDNTLVNFNNSTGISWTRTASTGEMTATLADNSATNEIQNLSYTNATRALGISSGSGVTLPLVSSTIPGLVSAYPNNTTSFLRGDGTWATPPTPAVTGTAPILVTSGNISLNYGTGLANSGGQLVTYNPSGSIYSGSDTTGETFDTSYEIVAMGTSAVSAGTDISYGTNNISITSASAAGRYEISYACCHDVQANSAVTYAIHIEGSENAASKTVIETVNGLRNCVSKSFLTTLSNGDTVDLRLKTTGMITGNSYGNANLTIIKI